MPMSHLPILGIFWRALKWVFSTVRRHLSAPPHFGSLVRDANEIGLHWNIEIGLWPDFWHFLPLRDAEASVEIHTVTDDVRTEQQGSPINLRWLTREGSATKLTIDPEDGAIIRFVGNSLGNDVIIENDDYWLGNTSVWLVRNDGIFRFGKNQAAQQPLSALRWRFIIKSDGNRYESGFRRFEIIRPNEAKFQIVQCDSNFSEPSEGMRLAKSIKTIVLSAPTTAIVDHVKEKRLEILSLARAVKNSVVTGRLNAAENRLVRGDERMMIDMINRERVDSRELRAIDNTLLTAAQCEALYSYKLKEDELQMLVNDILREIDAHKANPKPAALDFRNRLRTLSNVLDALIECMEEDA